VFEPRSSSRPICASERNVALEDVSMSPSTSTYYYNIYVQTAMWFFALVNATAVAFVVLAVSKICDVAWKKRRVFSKAAGDGQRNGSCYQRVHSSRTSIIEESGDLHKHLVFFQYLRSCDLREEVEQTEATQHAESAQSRRRSNQNTTKLLIRGDRHWSCRQRHMVVDEIAFKDCPYFSAY